MSAKGKTIGVLLLCALMLLASAALLWQTFKPNAPMPTPTQRPAAATPTPLPAVTSTPREYVLNKNTRRFHYPDCKSVPEISPKNRGDAFASREELLFAGYVSCGNCHP